MAEHLSDDEELEKLKQWWRESGKQTVATVALIVAGYFGWQGWQNHQQEQAFAGSVVYQQMVDAAGVGDDLSEESKATIALLATKLIDEYGSSQYGHFARLMMARLALEQDDTDTAVSHLQQVIDKADDDLSLVARLRLAKVQTAKGQYDAALALLNAVEPATMASSYAEAKGDIRVMQGDNASAYEAYNQALAALLPEENRFKPLLEMKLNQVKPVASADQTVQGDS